MKKELMKLLKKNKINHVKITYSGEGDDGNMEFESLQIGRKVYDASYDYETKQYTLTAKDKSTFIAPTVNVTEYKDRHDGSKWIKESVKVDKSLIDYILDFGYSAVDDMGDWVNNDGGGGTIIIDVKKNVVDVAHYQKETVHHHSQKVL